MPWTHGNRLLPEISSFYVYALFRKFHTPIDSEPAMPLIVILKQDKGRGVVVMDKHKYIEKCMSFLTTKQFKQVDSDPTKTLESKVQRSLRKLKSKLSHMNTRNYIQHVHPQESFMELQSYINYPLMVKLMIYQ